MVNKTEKEKCACCGEELNDKSDTTDTQDGEVCRKCFDMNYERCENCDDYINTDNTHSVNGYSYCDGCYDEEVVSCSACGYESLRDNMLWNDYQESWYCEDCYDENQNQLENDISFDFLTTRNKNKLDTKDYTIGVEIECLNEEGLCSYHDATGITLHEKNYLEKYVGAKEDGSLPENGVEFVTTPTSNDKTYEMLEILCKFLKKNSFDVNQKCGLHIHIGEKENTKLTPMTRHKIMIAYAIYKEALFAMLPQSRTGNEYCDNHEYELHPYFFQKSGLKEPEVLMDKKVRTRYTHLNFESWRHHKTLEVRNHSGTVNFDKILNWIKINVALFEFARNSTYRQLLLLRGSKGEFAKKVLIEPKLISYYYERVKEFKTRPRKKHYRMVYQEMVTQIKDIMTTNKEYNRMKWNERTCKYEPYVRSDFIPEIETMI